MRRRCGRSFRRNRQSLGSSGADSSANCPSSSFPSPSSSAAVSGAAAAASAAAAQCAAVDAARRQRYLRLSARIRTGPTVAIPSHSGSLLRSVHLSSFISIYLQRPPLRWDTLPFSHERHQTGAKNGEKKS